MNHIFPFLSTGVASVIICLIVTFGIAPPSPDAEASEPVITFETDAEVRARLRALLSVLCVRQGCHDAGVPEEDEVL